MRNNQKIEYKLITEGVVSHQHQHTTTTKNIKTNIKYLYIQHNKYI